MKVLLLALTVGLTGCASQAERMSIALDRCTEAAGAGWDLIDTSAVPQNLRAQVGPPEPSSWIEYWYSSAVHEGHYLLCRSPGRKSKCSGMATAAYALTDGGKWKRDILFLDVCLK